MGKRQVALQSHAANRGTAINDIQVTVQRVAQQLLLRYELTGTIQRLRLPTGVNGQRRDELWRHTCAELFVAVPEQDDYLEFNFSPSGEWAAYQFDAYRQGMRPADVAAPEIRSDASGLLIAVLVSLPQSPAHSARLQLGLTMVIEDIDSQHSYWALAHGAERPDFHRRDGFSLLM